MRLTLHCGKSQKDIMLIAKGYNVNYHYKTQKTNLENK